MCVLNFPDLFPAMSSVAAFTSAQVPGQWCHRPLSVDDFFLWVGGKKGPLDKSNGTSSESLSVSVTSRAGCAVEHGLKTDWSRWAAPFWEEFISMERNREG